MLQGVQGGSTTQLVFTFREVTKNPRCLGRKSVTLLKLESEEFADVVQYGLDAGNCKYQYES